jgi:phosphoglycolate phosphatase
MNLIDTFVFDFDSALAEFSLNFRLIRRQLRSMASAFLEPAGEEEGLSAFEFLDRMAERIGQMETALGLEYHSRGRLLITAVELAAAQKGKLLASTRPALTLLRQPKVKTVIISHGSTAAVRALFPDIRAYCDVFVPREEVLHVKPHPEHLLAALVRCGSDPHKTITVTADPSVIEMARKAGTLAGAVIADPQHAGELLDKKPDFVFEDAMSLLRLIEKETDRNPEP